ncbi:uncharacterized protein VTP21DRAFT_8539 [Calcarisporiella thermophila]|uniref:uncharacterized protein n=1 Tax=Calcarisporiella thermophila TaxID=911321 RepID=UPI003742E2EE
MINWRALILLVVGVLFALGIIHVLHYPYPYAERVDDIEVAGRSKLKYGDASRIVLATAGDEVFAVMFEERTEDKNQGIVRIVKRPLIPATSESTEKNEKGYEWSDVLTHYLEGAISHTSYLDGDENTPTRIAVLFHVVEDEDIAFYIRLYSITITSSGEAKVYWHHLQLPGSTSISHLYLGGKAIYYSRKPDDFWFRSIRLPPLEPHAEPEEHQTVIKLGSGEKGWRGNVDNVLQYQYAELCSVENEARLVFAMTVEDKDAMIYAVINVNNKSDMWRPEKPIVQLVPQLSKSLDPYGEYANSDIPTDDLAPKPIIVGTLSASTVAIPLINVILTFDCIKDVDTPKRAEASIPPLQDGSLDKIVDVALEQNGGILAARTGDDWMVIFRKQLVATGKMGARSGEGGIGWELAAVVQPENGFLVESNRIMATKVVEAQIAPEAKALYLLILYSDGSLAYFDLLKPRQDSFLWQLIRTKAHLLLALLVVVITFVMNEMRR